MSAAVAAIVMAVRAAAHDSPIDHVDRVVQMYAEGGRLHVLYRVRVEERQAMLELARMDADSDGKVSDAEREAFFAARVAELAKSLHVEVDGRVLELRGVGAVKLGADLSQTYHLSAAIGDVAAGGSEGKLSDDFSRAHPGAYRYSPRAAERGGVRVEAAEAPKVEQANGHPAMVVIRFRVVVDGEK
jgi:hypothetical protein